VGYASNFSTIALNTTQYLLNNDLCRVTPGARFEPFFSSWVPYSTYNGQVNITGRLCNEWIFILPGNKGVLVLDVDVNSSPTGVDLPVRFIAPGSSPVSVSTAVSNTTFIFSNQLVIGPVDPSVFDKAVSNPTCISPLVCEAGEPIEEEIYLFHDANDFQLISTNVADQAGDVAFVCFALQSNLFSYFAWLSQYKITFNTTWGVYGYCNFGSCFGGAEDRVGREASQGVTEYAGQCSNNTIIGDWYSLPPYSSSLCPDYANGTIGINGTTWYGCGWNVIERMKTINGSCLQANNFVEACQKDKTFPFPTASAIWTAAFASSDPTQGGCPEIGPNPEQQQNTERPQKKATTKMGMVGPGTVHIQKLLEAIHFMTYEPIKFEAQRNGIKFN
jgi:hypothetical protein